MKRILALCLAAGLWACAAAPALRVEKDFSFPAVSNAQQVKVAVFRACAKQGWKCSPVTPDSAEAAFARDGRQVWVDIAYSPRSYAIVYKHSTGLHDTQKGQDVLINPIYNRWVKRLSAQIDQELQKINQAGLQAPSQGV